MLKIRTQDYSEACIIHIMGDLNALSCSNLSQLLGERIQLNIPFVVLDLSDVNELTSMVQRVILEAYIKLHKNQVKGGGGIVLCGLSEDITRLIDMTGLSRLVSVYPSLDMALLAIEPG